MSIGVIYNYNAESKLKSISTLKIKIILIKSFPLSTQL